MRRLLLVLSITDFINQIQSCWVGDLDDESIKFVIAPTREETNAYTMLVSIWKKILPILAVGKVVHSKGFSA